MAIRTVNRVGKIKKKENRFKLALKEISIDFAKIFIGLGISLIALVIVRSVTGT